MKKPIRLTLFAAALVIGASIAYQEKCQFTCNDDLWQETITLPHGYVDHNRDGCITNAELEYDLEINISDIAMATLHPTGKCKSAGYTYIYRLGDKDPMYRFDRKVLNIKSLKECYIKTRTIRMLLHN